MAIDKQSNIINLSRGSVEPVKIELDRHPAPLDPQDVLLILRRSLDLVASSDANGSTDTLDAGPQAIRFDGFRQEIRHAMIERANCKLREAGYEDKKWRGRPLT